MVPLGLTWKSVFYILGRKLKSFSLRYLNFPTTFLVTLETFSFTLEVVYENHP